MYDPRRPRAATKLEKPPEEAKPEASAAQEVAEADPAAATPPEGRQFEPLKADKDGRSRGGGPTIMEPDPASAPELTTPPATPKPKSKRRAKKQPDESPSPEQSAAAPTPTPTEQAAPRTPEAQPSSGLGLGPKDSGTAVSPEVEDAINRLFTSMDTKPKRKSKAKAKPAPPPKDSAPPVDTTPAAAAATPQVRAEPEAPQLADVPVSIPEPAQSVAPPVAPAIEAPVPTPDAPAADVGLREMAAKGEKRKRGGGRAFLIVITVILLGAAGFLAYLLGRQIVSERAQDEAEGVARDFIAALTTYNAGSIEAQSKKVIDLSVGDFREDYERLVSNPDYRKLLTDAQADSKGQIVALAISSFSDDRAEVIAFVDVTTLNKDRPQPQVDKNRMEVSMVKTSKGWKIDNVELP